MHRFIAGNDVVLGMSQPLCYKLTDKGIPIEQAIEKQRLRAGSGFLSVTIHMDGPTQVISIKDLKEKKAYASPDDREWGTIDLTQRPILVPKLEEPKMNSKEYQFAVTLGGLGISLVSKKEPEELLYAHFSKIISETVVTPTSKQFCISVKDIQIDNQVYLALKPFRKKYWSFEPDTLVVIRFKGPKNKIFGMSN